MFDIPQLSLTTAQPTADTDLVEQLKGSELFAAQHALTPRRLDIKKVEAALRALVEAKGVLPAAVLAERAGEIPARATGFVSTMQRVFNVDNYPVLTLIDDGRTVRLDIRLLREQFRLSGERS